MLKQNSEIRSIARNSLKGNWTPAVLAGFIYFLVAGLAGGIPFVNFFTTFLLALPLGMSIFIVYLLYLRGDKDNAITNIFNCFKDYGRFLGTSILVFLFTLLWTLLFIIPGIIKYYAYSMTYYISHDNPQMKANDAIELSMKMMKGNKGKLFLLDLSFIGWFLLCILTLGIGLLWLYPYILTSRAAFYEDVKTAYESGNITESNEING